MVATLVGLLGGLLLSALFWYSMAHVIVPKITFGDHLALRTPASGERVLRLGIRNSGRRRAVDVKYKATIWFPGLSAAAGVPGTPGINLALSKTDDFVLPVGRTVILTLRLEDDQILARQPVIHALYPIEAQRDGLTLDALLSRSEGSFVVMHVLCSDDFSGSRRYFRSADLTRSNVVHKV